MTGLSKIFDDRLFYVYYVDRNIFKFKVTYRRHLWGQTFFEWAFDKNFYITIGKGEIKCFEENGGNYLALRMSLSPFLKIAIFIGAVGLILSPFHSKAIACFFPLFVTLPLLIVWIFAKFNAKSQIKLICNTT